MSRSDFVFNDIMGTPPGLARQMAQEIAGTPRLLHPARLAKRWSGTLFFGAGLAGALIAGLIIRANRQTRWS